jgi:ribosome-binding protein aMBF1 (putative translation factor)
MVMAGLTAWGGNNMTTESRQAVGEAVKLRRLRMGLSQEELGKRAGCSGPWISRLEHANFKTG